MKNNHKLTIGTVSWLFNWNDFYLNFSLDGLQSCSFFQNEIGTFNPDGSVKTIIDSVKMNNYNQYNSAVHNYLHH